MIEYRAAKALAAMLHDEKTLQHVQRVAERMETYGEATIAYLHDLLEDTPATAEYLLELGFSRGTVEAVQALTRSADETYASYIHRVYAYRDDRVRLVKLADIDDHFAQADTLKESLRKRYEKAQKTLCGK